MNKRKDRKKQEEHLTNFLAHIYSDKMFWLYWSHHHDNNVCSYTQLPLFTLFTTTFLSFTLSELQPHTYFRRPGFPVPVILFPSIIKCGSSRAALLHFSLLQLFLRPSPVITTQLLRATSMPTEKSSRMFTHGQRAQPTSIKTTKKLTWYW